MITEKQQKCIRYICSTLGIQFQGSTKQDAWQFIHDHIEQANQSSQNNTQPLPPLHFKNEPITSKQKRCIKEIETCLGIQFIGMTKDEASRFISEHLEDAKKAFRKSIPPLVMHKVQIKPGYPEEEFHMNLLTKEDFDMIPGGIHCADDIRDNGWLFALEDHNFHVEIDSDETENWYELNGYE